MPSEPQFFKGLDVRTNALVVDSQRAEDTCNVYLNASDELINRPFFSNYTFPAGVVPGHIKGLKTISLKSYKDQLRNYNRYQLAYASGDNGALSRSTSEVGRVIRINSLPSAGTVLQEDAANLVGESAAGNNYHIARAQYAPEVQRAYYPFVNGYPVKGHTLEEVDYFLGTFGLWKYDGLVLQRANNPIGAMAIASASGAVLNYYRSFLMHLDFSAQWVMGDYDYQSAAQSGNLTVGYTSPGTGEFSITAGMFDSKYIKATGNAVHDAALKTITIPSTSHKILVGDYITYYGAEYYTNRANSDVYKCLVKSVSGTEVVLDTNYLYYCDLSSGGGFKLQDSTDLADTQGLNLAGLIVTGRLLAPYILAVYRSSAPTTGFLFAGCGSADPDGIEVFDAATVSFPSSSFSRLPEFWQLTNKFEDCYDEGKVKGNLPLTITPGTTDQHTHVDGGTDIRFLAVFNNIILAANSKYVYFSDTSVGSTCENFDPQDFFTVGSAEDGPITGIFANEEYIIVHREKESFYLTGNLITGAYRSSPMNQDKLGAISHWAQSKLLSQNFFVSKKGAHAVSRGGNSTDLGELVEPIIGNSASTATLFGAFPRTAEEIPLINCAEDDMKNHVYIFYLSSTYSGVLVFNYRVKEWFRWKLPLSFQKLSGVVMGGASGLEGLLWTSDGTSLNVENTETSGPDADFDEGYWLSAFRNDGNPNLEKVYNYLKLYSFKHESIPFSCGIKVGFDWESDNLTDQGSLTLPNDDVTPVQNFNLTDLVNVRAYGFQFRISTSAYMKLQGFELNAELGQGEVSR